MSVTVHGADLDEQTRCRHWHGPTDVIAIRFACCDRYFACYECHAELEDHDATTWPRERFDDPVVLCGVCRSELSCNEYFGCGYACPRCGAAFNPGCAAHHHVYFER